MIVAPRAQRWRFALVLAAIVLLGLLLRLKGIHSPILDHPGWRQGDTAAIARNFATLDLNPFHPQTDYDGPPPNYAELELQIVPFLAAVLYKIFGIHEVFGRLISIAFSLGTVVACGLFARWAFRSAVAGATAALALAIYPGSVYYGRTFTPDTTMTFFLTAALYASVRWIVDEEARTGPAFWVAAVLMTLAILAKPVAFVGLVPIVATFIWARGLGRTLRSPLAYGFLAIAILPYAAYDTYLRSIAEWHWASGITSLHVLPQLRVALTSGTAFHAKFDTFETVLGMLSATMLGPIGIALAIAGAIVAPRSSARAALWAWLAAALLYAFVVVTVERVDYYLSPFLPLAAIWTGGLAATAELHARTTPLLGRVAFVAAGVVALAAAYVTGHAAVAPYYAYNKAVYRRAKALDATLAPGALIVAGHYDPSVLYYIGRKGWEEDPYLWTPFDEQSAIRKGARYFIAIEPRRLARNVELSHWLSRFPIVNANAVWPVYETDLAKVLPGAEQRWRGFRRKERNGQL